MFFFLKRIRHFVFILLNFLILIQKQSKYSFSTISIKILNLFLSKYITKNDTRPKFKNGISNHFTLLKLPFDVIVTKSSFGK
jgi:hypothetical protein